MARKKPPSFDFFADDFIAGTYHLPAEAVGIYIRLLCYQWSNGSIPKDEESLCRIAGVDALAMRTHMRTLCAKLCENDAGDYFNERLELERARKLEIIDKAKKSADLRWSKKTSGNPQDPSKTDDANAMRTHMPTDMRTHMPSQCSLLPTSNFQLPSLNTHTRAAPDWLQKDWKRWCDFREAIDGRPMDAIAAEAILMDLLRRGDGKAQRDIDFSIQKRAKSICDSDNDWAKNRNNGPTGSGRRYGKETAEEARIRKEAENPPDPEVAKRLKAMQEEMWKNGGK